jgi:fumarate hydratase, class II
MAENYRIEKDSMGELEVPKEALSGAQTQRAINNFPVSGLTLPPAFIRTIALIKKTAAKVNIGLGELEPAIGNAIIQAAQQIMDGQHQHHFPVDVFQTGSGTSTNMNVNEVLILPRSSGHSTKRVISKTEVNYENTKRINHTRCSQQIYHAV